jgi:hypothetical protein
VAGAMHCDGMGAQCGENLVRAWFYVLPAIMGTLIVVDVVNMWLMPRSMYYALVKGPTCGLQGLTVLAMAFVYPVDWYGRAAFCFVSGVLGWHWSMWFRQWRAWRASHGGQRPGREPLGIVVEVDTSARPADEPDATNGKDG